MTHLPAHSPSPEFRAAFLAAAGEDACLTYEEFIRLALYHPEVGYYRRAKTRVGFGQTTDFYTASSSGSVFGETIAAACTQLLQPNTAQHYTFVEIGSETDKGILEGVSHIFKDVRVLRVGEPLKLSGSCIVFSNELFDAQPFRRFVARQSSWKEICVALKDHQLLEVELDPTSSLPPLPSDPLEGYVIDAPIAARQLIENIARQPWDGLFVACDYGKTWAEIAGSCPQGTARAYYRHRQSNDLLQNAGEQDLTCHICWDWLVDALKAQKFVNVQVEAQESFLIRRASEYIAHVSTSDAKRFSARKVSLLQLLHPTQMGQKFQVLHARRP